MANSFASENFNLDQYVVENLNISEYEMNGFLVDIHKEINILKNEKADLLKLHFSKFIAARNVVDKIRREHNLDNINIDLKNISYLSNKIESQFNQMMQRANINIEEEREEFERKRILEKYSAFFTGEQVLNEFFETKSYDEFISTYKRIMRQYKKIEESKFIQEKYEKIKIVKNKFLNHLVAEIERKDLPTDEILYYFSLYFKINDKSEREKLENTLLVNFKIYLSGELNFVQLNSIDIFFSYFIKILKITKKFFIKEKIIEVFFLAVDEIYEKSNKKDFTLIRIFVDKMGLLLKGMRSELSNITLVTYLKYYKEFENKLCKNLWTDGLKILRADISNKKNNFEHKIKLTYELFSEGILLKCIEKIILNFISYKNWKGRIDNINYLKGINNLENKIRSIEKVLLLYEEKFSYAFLNKVKTKITKEEILAFADFKIEDKGNFEILMLSVVLKNKIPFSFEKLLFAQKEIFLKNNIRKFYLMKNQHVQLSASEKSEIEKLNKHFSFLKK